MKAGASSKAAQAVSALPVQMAVRSAAPPSVGRDGLGPLRRAPQAGVRLSVRKRCFDVVLASALLVALCPLLALVWIAVRLTSRGPGLFWSERVGFRNTRFMMPKFRTMTIDAPLMARERMQASAPVTPLGRLLRRYSIDELPQLVCIVCGHMSFIGPRPLIASDPAQLARARFPEALSVRPGLSGLAQVRGRNFVAPRRKARLDAFYARTRSWRLDAAIIRHTINILVSGRGVM